MKTIAIAFFLLFFSTSIQAQVSSDKDLNKRLDQYMSLNKELRFAELMEFIHPSLFKIAPKEQMLEVFKQVFNNEDVQMDFDSVATLNATKPYQFNKATYRKVDYFMAVNMRLKDTTAMATEKILAISNSIKASFQASQVRYNEERGVFEIRAVKSLMAIKDAPGQPWFFLGIEKNPALTKRLFPEPVRKYFKLL